MDGRYIPVCTAESVSDSAIGIRRIFRVLPGNRNCVIRYLLTALGFMCFFFPGIVVNYAYSQAYYLLAEDEKRSVIECLRESRRMMVGNKLTLFRLDLTYFFLVFASYLRPIF